ncbi:MAG: hypothetical protein ACKOX2_04845 [Microcystaceae cyanobacterium]
MKECPTIVQELDVIDDGRSLPQTLFLKTAIAPLLLFPQTAITSSNLISTKGDRPPKILSPQNAITSQNFISKNSDRPSDY